MSPVPRSAAVDGGPGVRVRRRGVTEQGRRTKYPNQAFENLNDARMFARITKGKDINFLNRINNKTIEVAENEMQRETQRTLDNFKPIKNYGGMISGSGLKRLEQTQYFKPWKNDSPPTNRYARDSSLFLCQSYNPDSPNFIGDDEGSVEINKNDFPPDDRRPDFSKSKFPKVAESIYNLKKQS